MTETAASAVATTTPGGRRTIAQLWRNAVGADRPGPAYLVESEDRWTEVSWAEADERVRAYANGLLARGVEKGDNLSLIHI